MKERYYYLKRRCCPRFPGGLGTLEEFSQLLSWIAIGLTPDKPIGILNIGGYYSGLQQLLETFAKRILWIKMVGSSNLFQQSIGTGQ